MPGNWVIGAPVNNVWSVGSSGNQQVDFVLSQPFTNYELPYGWYLVSAPIIAANWKARSGNKWTVPPSGGVVVLESALTRC